MRLTVNRCSNDNAKYKAKHNEDYAMTESLQKEDEKVDPREGLAVSRTQLANERTMLAYLRTALSLYAAAALLLQFFEKDYYLGIAIILLVLGTLLLAFGVYRFVSVDRKIKAQ